MISHARLLEVLRYEPDTGFWFWRVTRGKGTAGQRAGSLHPGRRRTAPYWKVGIEERDYSCSRLAWFYMTGKWPIEIDHRDGNAQNDRWANLREATRHQNEVNKGAYKNNKLGLKGVHFQNGKFLAMIMRNRQHVHLGSFDSPHEAKAAYDAAALASDGEFARVAWPTL